MGFVLCLLCKISCIVYYSTLLRLVFSSSIHLEVASGPFCLLVNSPWLLVFALSYFFLFLSGFNLYCWKGLHFSWSNSLIFLCLFLIVLPSSSLVQRFIKRIS